MSVSPNNLKANFKIILKDNSKRLFRYFCHVVDSLEPNGGICIRWHSPVASRRQTYAAYFRTVGQARALELLIEESAVEGPFPLQYRSVVVKSCECFLCKPEYSLRRESVTQDVVEEEVVQFVCVWNTR